MIIRPPRRLCDKTDDCYNDSTNPPAGPIRDTGNAHMRAILILSFCVSLAASLVLTAAARRLAARWKFMDTPGGRRQHERPTPKGGGIAIALACCLTILGAALGASIIHQHPTLLGLPDSLADDVARAAAHLPLLLWLLGGGLVIALFGFWDDLRPFPPVPKLIVQFVIATTVVIGSGMRISIFIPSDAAQIAITVVWIVMLTNSFNLLDNMDGLSATVAFLCGGALLIVALQTTQFFIAGFLLALMGAALGFLFFNLPPASIFMGDTGSMFLGYMLAVATTLATFIVGEHVNPFFPVLVPPIIFAVPLYDTLSVLAIRLHTGKPLLAGDRNHFSHRLLRLGMSPRRVLVTIGLVALATSLGATLPYGSATWRVVVPVVQAAAVVCVIMQLELAGAESGPPKASNDG